MSMRSQIAHLDGSLPHIGPMPCSSSETIFANGYYMLLLMNLLTVSIVTESIHLLYNTILRVVVYLSE